MARPDIREKTFLVIEKDKEYLSRREMLTDRIVWDQHLISAWKTRNREKAERMAERYGGRLALFNTITWEVRTL